MENDKKIQNDKKNIKQLLFVFSIKISDCWFNREKNIEKMQETNIITKEVKKVAKYYKDNIELLRENARNNYRNL